MRTNTAAGMVLLQTTVRESVSEHLKKEAERTGSSVATIVRGLIYVTLPVSVLLTSQRKGKKKATPAKRRAMKKKAAAKGRAAKKKKAAKRRQLTLPSVDTKKRKRKPRAAVATKRASVELEAAQ